MDALEAWRQWRTLIGLSSAETARCYGGNVLRFLAETGAKDPADYTEDDCASFLARYAPRGHARHEYAKALRSFFGWCERHLVVAISPVEHIQIRKPRRVPPVTLTRDELTRVLVAAVFELGEREAWAILLTYVLGLRRIEAAGLRWADVREGDTGPVIEIRKTKGADQRDPLPLTPLALECLARLHELPAPAQVTMGPEYILRVRPQTLSRWVHQAGVAAGLPAKKIGAHRLRATLATDLLRAGVDVRTVQKVLGHFRLESTAWYLAESGEAEVRAALARAGHAA